MTLQSVLVYLIQNKQINVLFERHFVVLHMDNQNELTQNVIQKIKTESLVNGGQISPHGIVNMYSGGQPQPLIYQNLNNFGVVFVFTSCGDCDNRIAAWLTLNAITTRMTALIKNTSIERVTAQPEDVYSILDSYIPNGQVLIVNGQVHRNL